MPTHQILALDHMMFVGVLTNAIFAMLVVATASRRPAGGASNTLVFAGINVGLVGFVVSLLAEATWLERIATPVLGAAIVVGLVECTLPLQSGSVQPEPIDVVPATATA